MLVASIIFIIPSRLHNSGLQITAGLNIHSLKLNFHRKKSS